MPFVEDMTPFFNAAEFATTALIGGIAVPVIFDAPYAAPFGESLDTVEPTCLLPSNAVAVKRGDVVQIAGITYRVERAEPDGTGATRLALYPTA